MTGPIIDRRGDGYRDNGRPTASSPPPAAPGERATEARTSDPNARRSEYVDRLPDWDLVPAQLIVRRPKKGQKGR